MVHGEIISDQIRISNVSECIICGSSTSGGYSLCKVCFNKLKSNGSLIQCPDCEDWHFKNGACFCQTEFIQCPDCGRWHSRGDGCVCKVSSGKANSAYQIKKSVLTESEVLFKKKLEQAIDLNKYELTYQTSLRQLVEKVKKWSWANELNRDIDFCVINKTDYNVAVCIEYDDSSHERPDRKERDEKVENILKEVGMKLIRIKRDDKMSVDYLKGRLSDYL
jgi:hypothetical protein